MTERFKTAIPVLGIMIAGICVTGLALAWLGVLPGFAGEEKTAEGMTTTPIPTVESPPANTQEPVDTETATFALG